MKNRILIITVVALMELVLCGCEAKSSGLYQINANEIGHDNAYSNSNSNSELELASEQEKWAEKEAGSNEAGSNEAGAEESWAGSNGSNAGVVNKTGAANKTGTSAIPSKQTTIFVHVCGAVNVPGVYELKDGDRVINAIEAAGGFVKSDSDNESADEDYINLAEIVYDGMKIIIPTKSEAKEALKELPIDEMVGIVNGQNTSTASVNSNGLANSSSKININTADKDKLCQITGIGPTRAAAIIAYRETSGRFEEPSDIMNVSGIGESTYSKMKDEITTVD